MTEATVPEGDDSASSTLDRLVEALQLPDGDSADPKARPVEVAAKLLLSETYKGAFPHPNVLKGLNEVIENGAERAFVLTEREQQHRHQCDEKMLNAEIKETDRIAADRRLIIILSFSILVLALVGSFIASMTGHLLASGLLGASGLAVLIGGLIKILPTRKLRDDSSGKEN